MARVPRGGLCPAHPPAIGRSRREWAGSRRLRAGRVAAAPAGSRPTHPIPSHPAPFHASRPIPHGPARPSLRVPAPSPGVPREAAVQGARVRPAPPARPGVRGPVRTEPRLSSIPATPLGLPCKPLARQDSLWARQSVQGAAADVTVRNGKRRCGN